MYATRATEPLTHGTPLRRYYALPHYYTIVKHYFTLVLLAIYFTLSTLYVTILYETLQSPWAKEGSLGLWYGGSDPWVLTWGWRRRIARKR